MVLLLFILRKCEYIVACELFTDYMVMRTILWCGIVRFIRDVGVGAFGCRVCGCRVGLMVEVRIVFRYLQVEERYFLRKKRIL